MTRKWSPGHKTIHDSYVTIRSIYVEKGEVQS